MAGPSAVTSSSMATARSGAPELGSPEPTPLISSQSDLSRSTRRSAAMTRQPALAKSRLISRPIPDDAPVTIATLPVRSHHGSRWRATFNRLSILLCAEREKQSGCGTTSNTGIVNQCVDTSEGGPGLLNGGLDDGTAGADIEHNSHGSGRRNGAGIAGTDSIDLVAERFEAVHSARRGDDSAAGFGQVEAEFSAQPRRGSGDHHHLSGVDVSERFPSLENGGLDGGAIRADVELNSHRSGRRNGVGSTGSGSIDVIAERFKPVESARSDDYSAAGFCQVDAEFSAESRRSSGDHHHLAGEVPPWLQVARHFR
nr:hypothetical protein B296_00022806 [Ipomoea batatas]